MSGGNMFVNQYLTGFKIEFVDNSELITIHSIASKTNQIKRQPHCPKADSGAKYTQVPKDFRRRLLFLLTGKIVDTVEAF
jgi:hypothetical protein